MNFDTFIKEVNKRKHQKKKSTKVAFEEFRAWRDGKTDLDTTLPLPPGRSSKKRRQ
jgi:hypothetical protein